MQSGTHSSEEIWKAYHGGLLSFIRYRVGDADLAEDILQNVFVKIHSKLDTLDKTERLQSWLYQIARNAVIDHYRTNKKTEPLPDDIPDCLPDNVPDTLPDSIRQEPDPAGKDWRRLADCLRPMIEMLPEGYRQAVILSDIEGLPLTEVATRLGLSLPGAKSRVQRGRARLRTIFLECCHFTYDSRGYPIDWSPKCGCDPIAC